MGKKSNRISKKTRNKFNRGRINVFAINPIGNVVIVNTLDHIIPFSNFLEFNNDCRILIL